MFFRFMSALFVCWLGLFSFSSAYCLNVDVKHKPRTVVSANKHKPNAVYSRVLLGLTLAAAMTPSEAMPRPIEVDSKSLVEGNTIAPPVKGNTIASPGGGKRKKVWSNRRDIEKKRGGSDVLSQVKENLDKVSGELESVIAEKNYYQGMAVFYEKNLRGTEKELAICSTDRRHLWDKNKNLHKRVINKRDKLRRLKGGAGRGR